MQPGAPISTFNNFATASLSFVSTFICSPLFNFSVAVVMYFIASLLSYAKSGLTHPPMSQLVLLFPNDFGSLFSFNLFLRSGGGLDARDVGVCDATVDASFSELLLNARGTPVLYSNALLTGGRWCCIVVSVVAGVCEAMVDAFFLDLLS